MAFDKNRILEYLIYFITPTFFLVKSYQVIAVLIVIVFVFDIIKTKNWNVFNESIFIILSLWCGYLFISALWAIEPRFAMSGALELFVWCLLYLAIRTTLSTRHKIEKFLKFQAWMILFVAFNSIMQAIIGFNIFGVHIEGSRVTDLITERRTIGHLLPVWLGLLGAMLAIPAQEKRQYLLYAFALMGLLITLPLTGTRGPLIILAIFLPLIAWMSPYRKWAFTALGVLVSVIVCIVLTNPILQQRVMSLKNPFEDQKHARISIWLTALEQFKDNPIAGVGFHNFRYREFEYYQDTFESNEIVPEQGKIVTHPHSPWMDILCEQGLLGLTFALSFLFVIARTAWKMGPIVMIGSMGVWYAFSILNSTFVLSSGRWSFFMILPITFFGLIVNYKKLEKSI